MIIMKFPEKKGTLKNYLILAVVFLVTMALTLYFCKCYYVYHDSIKEIPVIRGTLSEISREELDHYILENPNCNIYMCTASNLKCRSFEESFIKLIKKKNLQEDIVYLNLSDVNQDEFIKTFNEKYPYKIKLTTNYPAIVMFEENRVSNLLQENDKELTIIKTKQFIELNKIGE